MRLVKLLTYYTVPLLVLSVIFLPSDHTEESTNPDREFKLAKAMIDQYDQNNDQVLYATEFPFNDFDGYDFNNDRMVSYSELQYALELNGKQKFGDFAFYEVLPDTDRRAAEAILNPFTQQYVIQ